MLKALDRSIVAAKDRIVLLAPSALSVPGAFLNVDTNPDVHRRYLESAQRLRGGIYLRDGAIHDHQLENGLHRTMDDDKSWHFLLLERDGEVAACATYREYGHHVRFEDTRAVTCPLIQQREWRQTLWRAMDAELTRARRARMHYVEVGGWAVSEASRGTAAPLALVLSVWAFARRAGGALGVTTATFRHCSATVLKRLGGARFEIDGITLPPYFDSRYGCMMELLRFDSGQPNPKYVHLIDRMRDSLSEIQVIARPSAGVMPMPMPRRIAAGAGLQGCDFETALAS